MRSGINLEKMPSEGENLRRIRENIWAADFIRHGEPVSQNPFPKNFRVEISEYSDIMEEGV